MNPEGDECTYAELTLNSRFSNQSRVLRVEWDLEKDQFLCDLHNVWSMERSYVVSTKREFLKRTASIYDPLLFISPATMRLKVLFQKMCKQGCKWDENISVENGEAWEGWYRSALQVPPISIQRCYFPKGDVPSVVAR